MSADRGRTAADWWSGHLHYHEDPGEVVREVLPAIAETLDAQGLPWFFLRYWEGGSHVRLRVLVPPGRDRDTVVRLAESGLQSLVERRPSSGGMSPEEYAQVAAYLAGREGFAHSATGLLEDNVVHLVPYERETGRYGEGASIDGVEDHFVESSRLALKAVSDGGSPDTLGFEMLLAGFDVLRRRGWLDERGLTAVREGWRDPGGGVPALEPAALEERYQEQSPALLGAARTQVQAGACSTLSRQWVDCLETLVDDLHRAGSVEIGSVVDLALHLFCNRVGVTMPSEIYLRHLAARAIEDAA